MDKNFLSEIDSRIRSCLEIESKLEYLDSLLHKKKISKLEHNLFKQSILNNKTEEEVRRSINNYIEDAVNLKNKIIREERNNKFSIGIIAVLLIIGILFVSKIPAFTGLSILSISPVDENFSVPILENPSSVISASDVIANFTDSVRDSRGNKVNSSIEITDYKNNKKYSTESGKKYSLKKGNYKVKVTPYNIPVKSIEFENLSASRNISRIVGIESHGERNGFSRIYSIDPLLSNFTKANVTISNATGNKLYKCSNWDFTSQTCLGSWALFKTITPGKDYTFILTQGDPGFAETINITRAMHLDSNKTVIADIYPQVKSLDNLWSGPIPANDFVRIRFEKNLSSSNDITLYARNNQSTNTTVGVYYFNSSEKITTFPVISEPRYYKVPLSNMNGNHDTFDLKIEGDQDSYLEFDHIVDPNSPPTVSSVLLNSTHALNITAENLTVYFSASDPDGTRVTNITDWRRNGTSVNLFHMEFDSNISSLTSNQIMDYSSFKKNGTLGGGTASLAPKWTNDTRGSGGYVFDGKDDNIPLSSVITIPSGIGFSVETWVKPRVLSGGNPFILDRVEAGNSVIQLFITGAPLKDINFRVRGTNGVGLTSVTAVNNLSGTNWTHIVAVRNFSNTKLLMYVNGKLQASATDSTTGGFSHTPLIGAASGNTAGWNGTIDMMRFWNRSLTAREIKFLFQNKTNQLAASELRIGDRWQAAVTPNDKFLDGNMVVSNNVSIKPTLIITKIFPNQTNQTLPISAGTQSLPILRTPYSGKNLTFNVSVTTSFAKLTYSWFVNQVLAFTKVVTTLSSVFTHLFSTQGLYNVTVRVNGSDLSANDTFTFKLNVSCIRPINQMNITASTTLCNGTYNLRLGVDVRASRIKLVCKGTVLNGTRASINDGGILIDHVSNVNVSNCTTRNYFAGIFTNYSSNDTFRNNTDQTSVTNGIATFGGQRVKVFQNYVRNSNSIAIVFNNASNFTITNNVVKNTTGRGISFSTNSRQNNVSNNTILNSTTFGIALFKKSNNNTIFNNFIKKSSEGFHLDDSRKGLIFSNTIVNNSYGFTIFNSTGNILMNNSYANQSTRDIFTNGRRTIGTNGVSNNTLKVVRGSNILAFRRKYINLTTIRALFINNSIVSVNSSSEPIINTSANISLKVTQCTPDLYLSTQFLKLRSAIKVKNITSCTGCVAKTCTNNVVTFNKASWSTVVANSQPNITVLLLNSTHAKNNTFENLTVYPTGIDADGDKVTNMTDWRRNGTSMMVLYMSFDTNLNNVTARSVRDYSSFKNNGTLGAGTVSLAPKWTNDTRGSGGYRFFPVGAGATGQYINVSSNPGVLNLTKNVTILAWINTKRFHSAQGAAAVVAKDFSAGPRGFVMGVTDSVTNGNVYFEKGGSSLLTTSSGAAMAINQWYLIGVTYDGTNWKSWINGVVEQTVASTAIPGTAKSVTIGRRNFVGSELYYNGTIDEVRIYNRTISTQEMLQLNLSKTTILVSQELKKGERWQAAVTPNDVFGDGATRISNNVSINQNVTIITVQPNATGIAQNITASQNNLSISKNYSVTKNLTFNVTAARNIPGALTFRWFINKVLQFTQVLTSIFRSTFTHLFNSAGRFNVTVVVNGSDSAANDTFTFRLTTKNGLPFVRNVTLNSTHRTNLTNDNLTAYWRTRDPNNSTPLINITDWRKNGTSIAVINLAFESNGTYNGTDYSTFRNSVRTRTNVKWNKTNCVIGGCLEFKNPSALVVNISRLSGTPIRRANFSISIWIYPLRRNVGDTVMHYGADATNRAVDFIYRATRSLCFEPFGGSPSVCSGTDLTPNATWTHVVGTYNGSTMKIYTNGVLKASSSGTTALTLGNSSLMFGNWSSQGLKYLGFIDEFKMYNRTLTLPEIKLLNLTKSREKDDILSLNETNVGDRWQACVTPNDKITNGLTVCSNNVSIRNSVPRITNVILNSTHRTNLTTDNLTVYWTPSDPDNGRVINITDWRISDKSITLLNLPFEVNGTNNGTDYSTHRDTINAVNGNPFYSNTVGYRRTGAYKFDGLNDYLTVPNENHFDLGSNQPFSIEAWVNESVLPSSSTTSTVIVKSQSTGPIVVPMFLTSNNGWDHGGGVLYGTVCGRYNSGWVEAGSTSSSNALSTKVWHHMVCTFNGTAFRVYTDGVLKATSATTTIANNNFPVLIGGYDEAGTIKYFFNGTIDNIKIYNRSLTLPEILLLNLSKNEQISPAETHAKDRWQAAITPNDGFGNGVAVLSNNVTIRNIINISKIFSNASGRIQNITVENNISITRNFSLTRNLTFNVSAIEVDSEALTFRWFINKVLQFTQTLTSGFASFFTHLFNTAGKFNVTVIVNASNNVYDNFTFKLTTKGGVPVVKNVTLNSTHRTNLTTDNLTVYWRTTHPNNFTPLINVTDWRINSKSIARLNMPFENNSNSANNVTDYSTDNGTGGNVGANWTKRGYLGAAYNFSGTDHIVTKATGSKNFTWMAWVKVRSTDATFKSIITIPGPNYLLMDIVTNTGSFWSSDGVLSGDTLGVTGLSAETWYHVAFVREGDSVTNGYKAYLNGVLKGSANSGTYTVGSDVMWIGERADFSQPFRGLIDEVKIYNRSLSAQQILQIYRNRTNVIVSSGLKKGQTWKSCITPNDKITNGAIVCSNNVTIRNSPPIVRNVTLNSTHRINFTTDNLTVYWNPSDLDSDKPLINITDWRKNGTSIANVHFEFEANKTFNATDYSTYKNHVTSKGNSITWISNGGHDGSGAYRFPMTVLTDNMQFNLNGITNSKIGSITFWANTSYSGVTNTVLFSTNADDVNNHIVLHFWGDGNLYFDWGNNNPASGRLTTPWNAAWTSKLAFWSFLSNATSERLYRNGVLVNSQSTSAAFNPSGKTGSLGDFNAANFAWNGTLDNFIIWNRTLSTQEILLLNKSRNDIIDYHETRKNERWSACITPNDKTTNGATVCSNNVTIRSAIIITSIQPNASGRLQNITVENNVSLSRNYSVSKNITFNVTAIASGFTPVTFRWFINKVLTFTQVLTSFFRSTFTHLFNTIGRFNVTVIVNGSDATVNDNFTFKLTTKGGVPIVRNVTLNSTHRTNFTTDNLTVYWRTSDPNNNTPLINITDWRRNSTSIAIINLAFEANGTKNVTDYSTSKIQGITVLNGLKWNKTYSPRGGSYECDGVDDIINKSNVGTIDLPSGAPFSMSLRMNAERKNNHDLIMNVGSDVTAGAVHFIYQQPANTLCFDYFGLSNVACGTAPALGTWNFLVGTYDGSKMRFYLNGNLVGTESGTVTLDLGSGQINLCRFISQGLTYNGFVDDARFYNRTLTASEIKVLNLTDSKIVPRETKVNDIWKSCITANDRASNGATVCSNNVTIRNSPSIVRNVTLNSTHRTNLTTDNLTVYWRTSDPNNNTPLINITDWRVNGTSIMLINLPFEASGVKNATDYSTFRRNVTLNNGPFWNKTGSYDHSGTYIFNGKNQFMNTSKLMGTRRVTMGAWVNVRAFAGCPGTFCVIMEQANSADKGYEMYLDSSGRINCWDGTNSAGTVTINRNQWYHFGCVYNSTNFWLTINGVRSGIAKPLTASPKNESFSIGYGLQQGTYNFNGTIDDLRVYNRTLSNPQLAVWARNQSYRIVTPEARKNQRWQSCITPNDGFTDGTTVCSNNVTIRNSRPTAPTLVTPANGSNTVRYLNVSFFWNPATDADGDTLTYALNLTSTLCANQYFKDITKINYTSPRLQTVDVCGPYKWKVRANDSSIFGLYSGEFNFSIQPFVNITLTTNLSDFKTMVPGQRNDTTNETPRSFVVESNSNVLVNITTRATGNLWSLSGLGNNSFRFKVNTTSEPNSFNFTTVSQRTFVPMKLTDRKAVTKLKFLNANNSARIQFEITVPLNEPAGAKSSTVVITGAQSG